MRALLLTMGAPGAGKSTWIKESGLENYTISPDSIRLLMETPRMGVDGSLHISQKNDKRVWEIVFEILEERMKRGEFVVVDATHSRPRLINAYKKLAKKYRYRVYIVDFRDVSLEELLRRNRDRGYKNVPEDAVKNIYYRLQYLKPGSWVSGVIKPNEINKLLGIKLDWSEYDYIVFIGDVHGQYTELMALMETIYDRINDNHKIVFLGDYFDRGTQNVEVFRYLYNNLGNFYLLMGNHDFKWLPRYGEFLKGKWEDRKPPIHAIRTFEQFKEAGISEKEVKELYWRMGQLVYVDYHGITLFASHGGIPTLPTIFTPTEDLIFGVGDYRDSETVDRNFIKNTPDETYSIHGHRNLFNVPIRNTDRTFNLTGDVGHGLRALIVDRYGFTPVFQPPIKHVKPERKELDTTISEGSLLDMFIAHDGVSVVEQDKGLFSINFTRKVFRKRRWDDITVRARGLWVCIVDREEHICARGYDKFFNLNEREETKLNTLLNSFTAAVALKKYNGFLGMVGVDKRDMSPLVVTKASMRGDHVRMFREILAMHDEDAIYKYAIENDVTLLFEVIHPYDPHIVDNGDTRSIVLLDILWNSPKERAMSYIDAFQVSQMLGVPHKEVCGYLETPQDLLDLVEESENTDIFTNNGIEGYVVEFSDGRRVKIKTRWYKFWKEWRTKKDILWSIRDERSRIVEFSQRLHTAEDHIMLQVLLELVKKGINIKDMNIIQLRKLVLEEMK